MAGLNYRIEKAKKTDLEAEAKASRRRGSSRNCYSAEFHYPSPPKKKERSPTVSSSWVGISVEASSHRGDQTNGDVIGQTLFQAKPRVLDVGVDGERLVDEGLDAAALDGGQHPEEDVVDGEGQQPVDLGAVVVVDAELSAVDQVGQVQVRRRRLVQRHVDLRTDAEHGSPVVAVREAQHDLDDLDVVAIIS